jgi:hypothetical protein
VFPCHFRCGKIVVDYAKYVSSIPRRGALFKLQNTSGESPCADSRQCRHKTRFSTAKKLIPTYILGEYGVPYEYLAAHVYPIFAGARFCPPHTLVGRWAEWGKVSFDIYTMTVRVFRVRNAITCCSPVYSRYPVPIPHPACSSLCHQRQPPLVDTHSERVLSRVVA